MSSVCGVKRKHDKLLNLYLVQILFVESFLRQNLEIEVDISYNDFLYKYFNRLLKSGTSYEYSQLLTET